MKVALLSHLASVDAPTGAERSLALLANGLVKRGHQVAMAAPGPWAMGADLEAAGIEVTKRGGYAYVVAVRQGSPAAEAGVDAGEYIRTIAEASTREMSIFQVRRALSGQASSQLVLNMFGDGEGRELTINLKTFDSSPVTASSHPGGILLVKLNYLEP